MFFWDIYTENLIQFNNMVLLTRYLFQIEFFLSSFFFFLQQLFSVASRFLNIYFFLKMGEIEKCQKNSV